MKFANMILAVAALLAINSAVATSTTSNNVISAQEVFEAVKDLELPAGVALTGTVEPVKQPGTTAARKKAEVTTITQDQDDHKEWFSGYGGWGGIGGWGGLGPYRFGFSCGGIGGWAYPLGYWNAFGFGLYGGGCGLGIPFDGLFYC
ncbi:unnamed protein product [Globisporangium polare]